MSSPQKVNHDKAMNRLIVAICEEIVDTVNDTLRGKVSTPTKIANIFRLTLQVQMDIADRIIKGVDEWAVRLGVTPTPVDPQKGVV
jgi:hypothetical protein